MSDQLNGGSWPPVTRAEWESLAAKLAPDPPAASAADVEFRLGGFLRRWVSMFLIVVGAVVVREFWPWFPYLGLAIGAAYTVGRHFK